MSVRKRTVLGNVNFQELTVNLRKWVRKRTCVGKQQLFTHCKFKEEFIKLKQVLRKLIKLRKFLMNDYSPSPYSLCSMLIILKSLADGALTPFIAQSR